MSGLDYKVNNWIFDSSVFFSPIEIVECHSTKTYQRETKCDYVCRSYWSDLVKVNSLLLSPSCRSSYTDSYRLWDFRCLRQILPGCERRRQPKFNSTIVRNQNSLWRFKICIYTESFNFCHLWLFWIRTWLVSFQMLGEQPVPTETVSHLCHYSGVSWPGGTV